MRYVILTVIAASLSGCLLEVLSSTAIQSDLRAKEATAAKNTLNQVTNETGQVNLQRAVDLYHADKAAYPESLDQLVPNYIDSIPERADGGAFGYNPVTGRVMKDNSGPAPADYLMMERIDEAIVAYGRATGYYPPELDALTHAGYLDVLPRTAAGEPFLYDNQDGTVTHPEARRPSTASPARQPAGGVPAGGGGRLNETMTGVAIQQELNSSSNAGTRAAGTRGRAGARDIGATQNERHQKALEDLGL